MPSSHNSLPHINFMEMPSNNQSRPSRPSRKSSNAKHIEAQANRSLRAPGKENVVPNFPNHLNERGREYEAQRMIERQKRQERIRKLAAKKAANARQQSPLMEYSTPQPKPLKGPTAQLFIDDEEGAESSNNDMDLGVGTNRRTMQNNGNGRSYQDNEDDNDNVLSHEEEHSHAPYRFIPETFVPQASRQPQLKGIKPQKAVSEPSPTVPHQDDQSSVADDPRRTVSSPIIHHTALQVHITENQTAGVKRKANDPPSNISQLQDQSHESPPEEPHSGAESDDVALRAPKRRIRDFSGLERRIVELAIEEFQVYVCTKYAFPEDLEDLDEWVNDCWNNACERQESSLKLSTTHAKLIRKRTSTIRGRVKDKAVARVPSLYGFRDTTTDEDIEFNKQLGVKLLKDLSFIYKDAATFKGMYEHPILQAVINAQFFSNGLKSPGVEFSAAFNPIPDETIALIFTAVQFSITRWASKGMVNSSGLFTEEDWHPVYKTHLEGLKKWREYNENTEKAMARLKQKLFDFGSKIAGFKPSSDSGLAFSEDVLARAAAALEE